MTKPKVYLAGPISGLTFDNAQDWRTYAEDVLSPDIVAFSPLRGKDYLTAYGVLEDGYEFAPLSSDRGIMTRDHNDCQTVDLIFVNLLGATKRASVGTIMEIAWAFAYRKPLVVCMEPGKVNVHDHPMIREAIGFRAESIDEGLLYTRAILLPRASLIKEAA